MRYFTANDAAGYQRFSLEFCRGTWENRCPTLAEFPYDYVLTLQILP